MESRSLSGGISSEISQCRKPRVTPSSSVQTKLRALTTGPSSQDSYPCLAAPDALCTFPETSKPCGATCSAPQGAKTTLRTGNDTPCPRPQYFSSPRPHRCQDNLYNPLSAPRAATRTLTHKTC